MQIIIETVTAQVGIVPPQPGMPEGAVTILFRDEDSRISFPITIPKFQAMQLGSQILAASRGGEGNGQTLPPAEPVYGRGPTASELRAIIEDEEEEWQRVKDEGE